MMPRRGITPRAYFEYTVYPLEGVWSGDALNKASFSYTIMIRQPDFVTDEVVMQAREIFAAKKQTIAEAKSIAYEEIEEGLCVQMMHIGSYDDEPKSFAQMEEFANENGPRRVDDLHREIYISDPNKTASEKMKTVLQFRVQ